MRTGPNPHRLPDGFQLLLKSQIELQHQCKIHQKSTHTECVISPALLMTRLFAALCFQPVWSPNNHGGWVGGREANLAGKR